MQVRQQEPIRIVAKPGSLVAVSLGTVLQTQRQCRTTAQTELVRTAAIGELERSGRQQQVAECRGIHARFGQRNDKVAGRN